MVVLAVYLGLLRGFPSVAALKYSSRASLSIPPSPIVPVVKLPSKSAFSKASIERESQV